MAFKIDYFKDDFIDSNYQKALDELNQFFNFDWTYCTPKLFVLDSRKLFDQLLDYKTEGWLVGHASNRSIYVLDRQKTGIESDTKYSDEQYVALIKHELCHMFFFKLSNGEHKPTWLNEGFSLYLADQNKFRHKPKELKTFLKFNNKNTDGDVNVYQESGFVVEILINKFGKEKIFELIKNKDNNQKLFKQSFNRIYGFELNYKNLNKLYLEK